MSDSLASYGFDLTDIDILDTLYPDVACTPEEFEEDFGMDIGNLFHDFKNLYEKGIVDWSGEQVEGKKKMPHYKKFSKTKFFITPLGRTLFNDKGFNNNAYLGAYQKLVPNQELI